MRGLLCQHCANQSLQLHLHPSARHTDTDGFVACMICRTTRTKAALLHPETAYRLNTNVMELQDCLATPAECRACELALGDAFQLLRHYVADCPAAVLKCRFKGCSFCCARPTLAEHQAVCPVGRARCDACSAWIDKAVFSSHVTTGCTRRAVTCKLCGFKGAAGDMLSHLQVHRQQLQQQLAQQVQDRSSGRRLSRLSINSRQGEERKA